MHLRIKPADTSPEGWCLPLYKLGYSVTWHPRELGRTAWLIKKDGQAFQFVQSPSRISSVPLENMTTFQQEIVKHLVDIGLGAVVPRIDQKGANNGLRLAA